MSLPSALRRFGPDIALMALCAGLALHFRLEMLDSAAIGSDAVNPYLKAWLILSGRTLFPQGPFPESGYFVAWDFLPYLLVSHSLRGAMTARFCLNALSFLPLYIGLRRFAAAPGGPSSRSTALIASLVMALSPGLADTLLTGYQTFDVSLYGALPTLGALWVCFRGDDPRACWLIIPWLPVLAMLHPYAIVYAVASIWLVVLLWRREAIRSLVGSSLVAFLLALPQLYRYRTASAGRAGGLLGYLSGIAHSPGHFESLGEVLRHVALEEMIRRDIFPHGVMLVASGVTLLLVWASRRSSDEPGGRWLDGVQRFSIWTLIAQAAMVGVAALVGYLQPYHLRVLFPVMAVQLALLLTVLVRLVRLPGQAARATTPARALLLWGSCAALAAVMILDRFPPPPPFKGSLVGAEAISAQVRAQKTERPIVLEYIHLSNDIAGYPGAIVLDQLLAGAPRTRFVTQLEALPGARFLFALTGPPAIVDAALTASDGITSGGIASDGIAGDGISTAGISTAGISGAGLIYRTPERDLALIGIDGLEQVREWSARLCEVLPATTHLFLGGANDYLGVLNPRHDSSSEAGWFAACLMRRQG